MHIDKLRSSTAGSVIISYKHKGKEIKQCKYPKSMEGQRDQFNDRKEWTGNGFEYTFDRIN